jgi:hypothetical protein
MDTLPEDVYDELVDSGLIAYQSIFIKVKSRGKFGDADLDRNCIKKRYSYSWDDDPDHVKKFGQMLDSKPGLDLNVRCFLRISLTSSVLRVLRRKVLGPRLTQKTVHVWLHILGAKKRMRGAMPGKAR